MRWIYLSPHFDDVALSCGGLVWEQARRESARQDLAVEVWTVCAGGPEVGAGLSDFAQELHTRWGTGPEAVLVRQAEDERAIRLLGATLRSWDLPDCIYRRLPGGEWLVNNNDELWQPLPLGEQGVVDRLADWIILGIGQGSSQTDTRLVSPLTLGNHVDHSLVRAAAEQAAARSGAALWYYPDYPYAVNPETSWAGKTGAGWQQACQSVSRAALSGWQEAVAQYESQISTFWSSREDLDASIEAYWQAGGGTCLWQPG